MKIVPSILASTPSDWRDRFSRAVEFSPIIQVDFIDERFVPGRQTLPVEEVGKLLRSATAGRPAPRLVAHLLTCDPEPLLPHLAAAGFSRAIFHLEALTSARPEAERDPRETADQVRLLAERTTAIGLTAGVGLTPGTDPSPLARTTDLIAEILFLAVSTKRPGIFLPEVLESVEKWRRSHPGPAVSVDGGVAEDNIRAIAASGADIAYVGHTIFDAEDPPRACFERLRFLIPTP